MMHMMPTTMLLDIFIKFMVIGDLGLEWREISKRFKIVVEKLLKSY